MQPECSRAPILVLETHQTATERPCLRSRLSFVTSRRPCSTAVA